MGLCALTQRGVWIEPHNFVCTLLASLYNCLGDFAGIETVCIYTIIVRTRSWTLGQGIK